MRLLEVLPIEYDQLGQIHEPVGNGNAYVSPSGMFRAGDGQWVSFTAATQNVFQRLCKLLRRDDLLADPRYASNQQRMKHQPELNAIVAAWIGARTARDAVRELSEAGVAVAPVYSNADLMQDPHFRARGAITHAADEDFGTVAVPCVVPRLSATPGEVRTSGPAPGAHNAEIYGDWLGMSAAELSALAQSGVI